MGELQKIVSRRSQIQRKYTISNDYIVNLQDLKFD